MQERDDEKRKADRERKRRSRANKGRLDMPLPAGTSAALDRVAAAAGFGDRREVVALVIHKLDALLACDRHAFDEWTKITVTVGDLSKYVERIQSIEVNHDDE